MSRSLSFEQMREALRNITPRAKQKIKQAMTKSALLIERDAKINAPFDTGTMRNRITHKAVEEHGLVLTVNIGSQVHYSKYVEYGTSKMAARPFIGDAITANTPRIKTIIGTAIIEALRGG